MTTNFLLFITSIPVLAHREFAIKIGQLNESRRGPSHEQHYKQPSTTTKLIRGEGGIEIIILVFSELNNTAVVGIIIITTY